MHVQPHARTLNIHRRPPDLQMWLCQRECSPTPTTHESFCSTRPSASASPHTVYSFEFVINGPRGQGRGTLSKVTILNQPGPPLVLSWTIGLLPLIALVMFIAVAWRTTKPGRQPLTV